MPVSMAAADLLTQRIRNKPLMTVAEVAEYLGVDERTIWRWGRQGKLPLHRISAKCTRIKRTDVETLVDAALVRID